MSDAQGRLVNEMHAHEVYPHEMNTHETHAYEIHALEMHARKVLRKISRSPTLQTVVRWSICRGDSVGAGVPLARRTLGSMHVPLRFTETQPKSSRRTLVLTAFCVIEASLQNDHDLKQETRCPYVD